MHRIHMLIVSAAVALGTLPAEAGNWPQFRGPQGSNVPAEAQLPSDWGQNKNIAWTYKVEGKGWSSPIIWGDKVFITTAVSEGGSEEQAAGESSGGGRRRGGGRRTPPDTEYRWEVHCLDLGTGKAVWKRVAFKGKPRIATHRSNTYASETPVTDGERIYAYFGMTGLCCYDLDGNFVWKKDLGVYPMQSSWGTSSSPVLYGESLYLQIDNEEESFLVALDHKTGDERWRVARDEKSTWSNPFVWRNESRTELVTVGVKVRSYDPGTGDVFWKLNLGGGRCIATPAADRKTLYVANEERNGGGTLYAVKAGASGDITPKAGESTSAGVVWSTPKAGIAMASPLLYQGNIYAVDRRNGMVSCYDATTGEAVFSRERLPDGKALWATPWGYDGKVFCPDQEGTTHVLRAGKAFEVLDTNTLDDFFWATPAFASGTIVLRGVENVYCIREEN
jgi:hypothetical protein